jgi:hypothetical protein
MSRELTAITGQYSISFTRRFMGLRSASSPGSRWRPGSSSIARMASGFRMISDFRWR